MAPFAAEKSSARVPGLHSFYNQKAFQWGGTDNFTKSHISKQKIEIILTEGNAHIVAPEAENKSTGLFQLKVKSFD